MASALHFPSSGCEHLDNDSIAKIKEFQTQSAGKVDENFVQYSCTSCPTIGSFSTLDSHFLKTKHEFAISQKSIYCGRCNDLVYESSIFQSLAKKRKLAQFNEEDDTYMSTNTTDRPCGREGVRGLFNLGETCYMNAVLQMMVHNPLLSSYFLGMGHPIHLCPISKEPEKKNDSESEEDELVEDKPDQKTCIACGMTEVFSDAAMADSPLPAHAVNLLFASWKNIKGMSGKQQQDAQEWFIQIVDKLHESVTNNSNPTFHCSCFFHKVFYGRLSSEITCEKCGNISRHEEEYSTIGLDFKKQAKKKKKAATLPDIKTTIPVPNIYDCLRGYCAVEPLSPDQYKCRECKINRSASKRVGIRKLPAILSIQVKRFGGKVVGNAYTPEKYEGKLDFPLVLDMAPYTTMPEVKPKDKYVYDLECVVVHQGEHAHSGHYFAFCRQDGKWFRFDDEIVSATTTEDVMRQEAYLLFYSLRALGSV